MKMTFGDAKIGDVFMNKYNALSLIIIERIEHGDHLQFTWYRNDGSVIKDWGDVKRSTLVDDSFWSVLSC